MSNHHIDPAGQPNMKDGSIAMSGKLKAWLGLDRIAALACRTIRHRYAHHGMQKD